MQHPRAKTKWCEFYWRSHGCRHGWNCRHAHTIEEYRGPRDEYVNYYISIGRIWERRPTPAYGEHRDVRLQLQDADNERPAGDGAADPLHPASDMATEAAEIDEPSEATGIDETWTDLSLWPFDDRTLVNAYVRNLLARALHKMADDESRIFGYFSDALKVVC